MARFQIPVLKGWWGRLSPQQDEWLRRHVQEYRTVGWMKAVQGRRVVEIEADGAPDGFDTLILLRWS